MKLSYYLLSSIVRYLKFAILYEVKLLPIE